MSKLLCTKSNLIIIETLEYGINFDHSLQVTNWLNKARGRLRREEDSARVMQEKQGVKREFPSRVKREFPSRVKREFPLRDDQGEISKRESPFDRDSPFDRESPARQEDSDCGIKKESLWNQDGQGSEDHKSEQKTGFLLHPSNSTEPILGSELDGSSRVETGGPKATGGLSIETDDSKQTDNRLVCTVCSKPFKKRSNLMLHMESHKEGAIQCDYKTCPVCKKTFSRNQHLRRHMRIHEGGGKQCDHCGQTFTRQVIIF